VYGRPDWDGALRDIDWSERERQLRNASPYGGSPRILTDLQKWLSLTSAKTWSRHKSDARARPATGGLSGWHMLSFIVKSNDDMRQEQIAVQLISEFADIFKQQRLPLRLRTYNIIPLSATSGLVQTVRAATATATSTTTTNHTPRQVPDALSIDGLLRKMVVAAAAGDEPPTLGRYFATHFGGQVRGGALLLLLPLLELLFGEPGGGFGHGHWPRRPGAI
jgi:hypothetical protein